MMRLFEDLTKSLIQALVLVALVAGIASAVELRESEFVVGGSPLLQNELGTLKLEDPRLAPLSTIVVPEPSPVLSHIGFGIGLLVLLAGRRRRHTASPAGLWTTFPTNRAMKQTRMTP
jgi:hypothetical protein